MKKGQKDVEDKIIKISTSLDKNDKSGLGSLQLILDKSVINLHATVETDNIIKTIKEVTYLYLCRLSDFGLIKNM